MGTKRGDFSSSTFSIQSRRFYADILKQSPGFASSQTIPRYEAFTNYIEPRFPVFTNFNKSRKSFAEALKQDPVLPSSRAFVRRAPSHRLRQSASDFSNRCYRCGGGGHWARNCREPVRCFGCGSFGHKKINCLPKYRSDSSGNNHSCSDNGSTAGTISQASLVQSWSSMILLDDYSIRKGNCSREELNEELFHFNLKYVKLRSALISSNRPNTVALLSLLDGLFNSSSKVQLGLKVQVYKLNWGSIRASSSSSSIRASAFQLGLQLGFIWVSNFS